MNCMDVGLMFLRGVVSQIKLLLYGLSSIGLGVFELKPTSNLLPVYFSHRCRGVASYEMDYRGNGHGAVS